MKLNAAGFATDIMPSPTPAVPSWIPLAVSVVVRALVHPGFWELRNDQSPTVVTFGIAGGLKGRTVIVT